MGWLFSWQQSSPRGRVRGQEVKVRDKTGLMNSTQVKVLCGAEILVQVRSSILWGKRKKVFCTSPTGINLLEPKIRSCLTRKLISCNQQVAKESDITDFFSAEETTAEIGEKQASKWITIIQYLYSQQRSFKLSRYTQQPFFRLTRSNFSDLFVSSSHTTLHS